MSNDKLIQSGLVSDGNVLYLVCITFRCRKIFRSLVDPITKFNFYEETNCVNIQIDLNLFSNLHVS